MWAPAASKRKRTRGVLVVVLALAMVTAACRAGTPDTTDGAVVVTPEQAQEIARAGFDVLSEAWASGREDLLSGIATGAALLWQTRVVTSGTTGAPVPRPDDVEVFVPRQADFPAHFLARMSYARSYLPVLLVFVSEGETNEGVGGWKVATLVIEDEDARLPRVGIDESGYAREAPGIGPYAPALDPYRLGASLAAYLERWDEGEEAPDPGPFEQGDATTGFVEVLREYRALAGGGWDTTFSAPGLPSYAYATADGGAVALFSVLQREEWASPSGELLRVGEELAASIGILPGDYQAVGRETLVTHAVSVPAPRTDRQVTWIGTVVSEGPPRAT